MKHLHFFSRLLTTLLIALASYAAVVGCTEPEANNDEYYVKYEFCCQVTQYGKLYPTPYKVTFTNSSLQKETREYKTAEKEEIICGPFKYKDNVEISLSHYYHDNVGGSSQAQTFLEVYVSKNNSPFALRKTENSSSQEPYTTQLGYTIDY